MNQIHGRLKTGKVRRGGDGPAELVEHSDVGIHVVDVVGVGRVLGDVPLLWLGALGREHVAAVLGLVVHAVKARHLGHGRTSQTGRYTGNRESWGGRKFGDLARVGLV